MYRTPHLPPGCVTTPRNRPAIPRRCALPGDTLTLLITRPTAVSRIKYPKIAPDFCAAGDRLLCTLESVGICYARRFLAGRFSPSAGERDSNCLKSLSWARQWRVNCISITNSSNRVLGMMARGVISRGNNAERFLAAFCAPRAITNRTPPLFRSP